MYGLPLLGRNYVTGQYQSATGHCDELTDSSMSDTDSSTTANANANSSGIHSSLTDYGMTDLRVVTTGSKVSNAPQLKTPQSNCLACVWSTVSNHQHLGTSVTSHKLVQHVHLV